jgi:hypothetical protein
MRKYLQRAARGKRLPGSILSALKPPRDCCRLPDHRRIEVMAAAKKYLDEVWERAIRPVRDLAADGVTVRFSHQA